MTPLQPQKQRSDCEACEYSFNCYHTPQCKTTGQCDAKSHKKHKKSRCYIEGCKNNADTCGHNPKFFKTPESPKPSQSSGKICTVGFGCKDIPEPSKSSQLTEEDRELLKNLDEELKNWPIWRINIVSKILAAKDREAEERIDQAVFGALQISYKTTQEAVKKERERCAEIANNHFLECQNGCNPECTIDILKD